MPLATKTKSTVLPESLLSQIENNFAKDESAPETTPAELPVDSKAKSKYSDSVNLRLTTGKRNEFKTFFTQCEISMNQGFEMAVDYLIREVKAGNIKVSKSGITKIGE